MQTRVYVLCREAGASSLYQSWSDRIATPVKIVEQPPHRWQPPEDAGLVVTHLHYHWEILHALRQIVEVHRVPVLILADGVLEYRNTWMHEDLPEGAMFQPLFGHKIACLGFGQAKLIETWGNAGRCEVVGLPRLDGLEPLETRRRDDFFQVLIATANTPSFDDAQHRQVLDSLQSLREWAVNRTIDGRQLKLVWRVNETLTRNLDLAPETLTERPPLPSALASVDAVITTPSTLYLESALYGRPTAILDFFNVPSYVPSAWKISAEDHFESVVSELANPPPGKLHFQNFCLHDQLECHSPATPRMVSLVEQMMDFGTHARENNEPIKLPNRILPPPSQSVAALDLLRMYPDSEAFAIQELQRMQVELTAAVKRLQQLPDELASQKAFTEQVLEKNRQLKTRIRELHGRVKKLRGQLGIDGPDWKPDPQAE